MAQGPADQAVKCGPHNRQPVGHATQHRGGASQGPQAAGLGKIEVPIHKQGDVCPCGKGQQSRQLGFGIIGGPLSIAPSRALSNFQLCAEKYDHLLPPPL